MEDDQRFGMFFGGLTMIWFFGSFAAGLALHLFWGFTGDEAFAAVAPWAAFIICSAIVVLGLGFFVTSIFAKD